MPRGKKNTVEEPDVVEIGAMDFDRALKIVRGDIMPANSKSGEYAQEASTAYKAIKKQCHIQPGSVKDAIKIANKEEAKRDDFLRGLVGMVNLLCGQTLLQFVSNDLVDRAESGAASNVVPLGRVDGGLATLGGDDDFEASPEELAQQEGRPAPAPGTAAEAMAAMKAKEAAEAAE